MPPETARGCRQGSPSAHSAFRADGRIILLYRAVFLSFRPIHCHSGRFLPFRAGREIWSADSTGRCAPSERQPLCWGPSEKQAGRGCMSRPAVSQFGESAHGIGRRRCPSVRTWGRFRVSGHAADGLGAQRRGRAAGGQARRVRRTGTAQGGRPAKCRIAISCTAAFPGTCFRS